MSSHIFSYENAQDDWQRKLYLSACIRTRAEIINELMNKFDNGFNVGVETVNFGFNSAVKFIQANSDKDAQMLAALYAKDILDD